jgi:hypothetical protein
MTAKDANAAAKTTLRGCFIAINAAIKNVLSPSSEMMIIVNDSINECSGAEAIPEAGELSDPSKSKIECNGDRSPSESESSYTTCQHVLQCERSTWSSARATADRLSKVKHKTANETQLKCRGKRSSLSVPIKTPRIVYAGWT